MIKDPSTNPRIARLGLGRNEEPGRSTCSREPYHPHTATRTMAPARYAASSIRRTATRRSLGENGLVSTGLSMRSRKRCAAWVKAIRWRWWRMPERR